MSSSPDEKDMEMLLGERLTMAQQWCTQPRMPNVLGCIKSSIGSRVRVGILLVCSSLVSNPLDCCVLLWDLQHKDMDLLQQVQRRIQSCLESWRPLLRMREFSPEKRRLGKPYSAFQIPRGIYRRAGGEIFTRAYRTKG